MLERDYLVRMLVQFAQAIRQSMQKAAGDRDPRAAADMLEAAVAEATDIDGGVLLSLAPKSIAGVIQVSGTDPRVTAYIARSLLLASTYLHEAGDHGLADIRAAQARAIADAYAFDLPDDPRDVSDLEEADES